MTLALYVCGAVYALVAGYSLAVWFAVAYKRPRAGGRWRRRGWIAKPGPVADLDGRPGIYVQWTVFGIPAYVGQSIDPDDRLRAHGKDVRAPLWTHWTWFECDRSELNDLERTLIRLWRWTRWSGMNRTGGGS